MKRINVLDFLKCFVLSEYFIKRRDHIASDDSQEVGYNLTLNDMQSAVNNIIYYHKKQEVRIDLYQSY